MSLTLPGFSFSCSVLSDRTLSPLCAQGAGVVLTLLSSVALLREREENLGCEANGRLQLCVQSPTDRGVTELAQPNEK